MSDREQFNVRIDETVANRFRSFVQDHRGDRRGALGRETENALREYMDNDRGARIEANLDILLEEIQEVKTLLDQKDAIHTQKSSDSDRPPETVRKLNEIISRIHDDAEHELVKDEQIERAIKHVAGANSQTIRQYKSHLKSGGHVFRDPEIPSNWYLDEKPFYDQLRQCRDRDEILKEYPRETKQGYESYVYELYQKREGGGQE